jgi:hypothetical protein
MTSKIGQAAGKVWAYLHGHGTVSTGKVIREAGVPRDLAQRAIGWLAREDKLHFEDVKGAEHLRLK